MRRHRKKDAAWTPFERGVLNRMTPVEVAQFALSHNITLESAQAQMDRLHRDTIWLNNRYQVNVADMEPMEGSNLPKMVHLSIKRLDKGRIGPERYRDFMRIKDELVGPGCEAVELYPARNREVDTANQYHLWCLIDPSLNFPFGFKEGRVIALASSGKAVQHPFDEDHHHPYVPTDPHEWATTLTDEQINAVLDEAANRHNQRMAALAASENNLPEQKRA